MADINYTEYNSDNQYLRDIAGLSMSNNYTDYKSDNELLKIISDSGTGGSDPLKVNKTGDTMTGKLDIALSAADVAYSQSRAGTKMKWGVGSNSVFGVYNETSGVELLNVWPNNLRLGTQSGVGFIRGTGFPNGVVSAPVGSTYIDTNATNGAIEWKKATGTGNTGWVVSVGDTGWRDISPLIPSTSTTGGQLTIRRIGNDIYLRASDLYLTSTTSDLPLIADIGTNLGVAFRPVENTSMVVNVNSSNAVTKSISVRSTSTTLGITHTGEITSRYWAASYPTTQSWPTTLPGTAI